MAAWSCCDSYNEHAEDCPAILSEKKIQEQAETIKILTEALEYYSKGDGMMTFRNLDNTVGYWDGKKARAALDRVKGK